MVNYSGPTLLIRKMIKKIDLAETDSPIATAFDLNTNFGLGLIKERFIRDRNMNNRFHPQF